MNAYTTAVHTDLDPNEPFPLRDGMAINRGSILTILFFLDQQGVTTIQPADGGSLAEWAVSVIDELDPVQVEERALDAVPPGAGKASVTRAVMDEIVTALQEAAHAGH